MFGFQIYLLFWFRISEGYKMKCMQLCVKNNLDCEIKLQISKTTAVHKKSGKIVTEKRLWPHFAVNAGSDWHRMETRKSLAISVKTSGGNQSKQNWPPLNFWVRHDVILNYREEDSNNWPWLVGWLCAKAFWRMNMPQSPVHYSLDGLVIIPVCRQNGMLWLLSCTSLATCPSSSTCFMPTMILGNWCLFVIHFFLSWYNFFF